MEQSTDPSCQILPADNAAFAKRHLANGEAALALRVCKAGLAENPKQLQLLLVGGIACRALGDLDQAYALITQATLLSPDNPSSHSLLGDILLLRKQPNAAIDALTLAIALNDRSPQTCFNLGTAYLDVEKFEMAKSWFDRALSGDPAMVAALVNKGLCEQSLMHLDAALQCFDMALQIDPNNIDAQWNASHVLLSLGQYEAGFALYETRWRNPKIRLKPRYFDRPLWLGNENLSGKTLLLHAEGGFGDTIQFIRYAKLFDADVDLVIQCQAPLAELLRGMGLSAAIITSDETPLRYDFHCPLMSLPLAFKTTLKTIPAFTAYLAAPEARKQIWQNALAAMKGPKIGLVARGSSSFANDQNRSIGLAKLVEYLPPSLNYVLLQKEVSDEEMTIINAHKNMVAPGDRLNSFSDTAALCALMDVVISVDTSVAHLAAALGTPTVILLPYRADWRWGHEGDATSWYPSARLCRQTAHGEWESALNSWHIDCLENVK